MARARYYVATANPCAGRRLWRASSRPIWWSSAAAAPGCRRRCTPPSAGLSVVLLEGGRVGWGASGRNGGQMIPGLRKGAVELVAAYGVERARALLDLAVEARDLVLERIERHASPAT